MKQVSGVRNSFNYNNISFVSNVILARQRRINSGQNPDIPLILDSSLRWNGDFVTS